MGPIGLILRVIADSVWVKGYHALAWTCELEFLSRVYAPWTFFLVKFKRLLYRLLRNLKLRNLFFNSALLLFLIWLLLNPVLGWRIVALMGFLDFIVFKLLL